MARLTTVTAALDGLTAAGSSGAVTSAAVTSAAEFPWLDVAQHALVDLVLLVVLVGVAYRRSQRDTSSAFALVVLNIGLFATLIAVTGDSFTTGAGFGLFGMLSLIRLRSASFTSADMAYAFAALVLGLVMGMIDLPLLVSGGLATAVVVAVLVAELLQRPDDSVTMTLILDRAHPSVDAARVDAQARLHLPVRDLTIVEVDYVKDVTTVTVVCWAMPAAGHPLAASAASAASAAPADGAVRLIASPRVGA